MSKYTTTLREIEKIYGHEELVSWFCNYELLNYLTQDEINVIIERDTWSKEYLAEMCIEHYYFREIGFETPYLFRHYLKITLKEIMERMLPLIYSASISYNPLENINITETYTRTLNDDTTTNGESNSTTTNNGSGLIVNSVTPQGQISKQAILSGQYASDTSANEGTSNATDNVNSSNTENKNVTENTTTKRQGNEGIYITNQKMIQEYRDLIIGINSQIIDELNQLFMLIY